MLGKILSVLPEYMRSAVNGLPKTPKIFDLTKGDVFQRTLS